MSTEKQKTVEIEGVVLTQKGIDVLKYFQGDGYHDNGGIKGMNETLSDAIDVILDEVEGEESERETEMTMIHSLKNLKGLLSDLGAPRTERTDDPANKEVEAFGTTEEGSKPVLSEKVINQLEGLQWSGNSQILWFKDTISDIVELLIRDSADIKKFIGAEGLLNMMLHLRLISDVLENLKAQDKLS